MKEKWSRYKPIWEKKIPDFIDNTFYKIYRAARRNEVMWPDWLKLNKYPEVSYDEIVGDMKEFIYIQMNWMDEQISNM